MKQNIKSIIIEAIISLLSFILFCLVGVSIFMPIIIDFSSASTLTKVLMVIGTLFAGFILTINIFVQYKINNVTKRFVITQIIVIIIYVLGILCYLDGNLWQIKDNVFIILIATLFLYGALDMSYTFAEIFSNDKIVQFVLMVAFATAYVGFLLSDRLGYKGNICFKISLGLIYLYVLLTLVETYLLQKPKIKYIGKYDSAFSLLKILIIITTIFTFPIYISWLGVKNMVMTYFVEIYACVVGGVITLAGVAWTIKNQKVEKLEVEKLKCKPWFTAHGAYGGKPQYDNINYYDFSIFANTNLHRDLSLIYDEIDDNQDIFYIAEIICVNSDNSNFIIKKVVIDQCESYQQNNIIKKNEKFYISGVYAIEQKGIQPKIKIYTEDILQNEYVFTLDYKGFEHQEVVGKKGCKSKKITITNLVANRIIDCGNNRNN